MNELTREKSFSELEAMLKMFEQVDLPVTHHHIPGVLVRAMFIKQGTVLTGKIHNYPCISIIAYGMIAVECDCFSETRPPLKAGDILVSEPGIKRAGYALEDTLFITVHRTDLTNIKEIEQTLVSDTLEQYKALELQQ